MSDGLLDIDAEMDRCDDQAIRELAHAYNEPALSEGFARLLYRIQLMEREKRLDHLRDRGLHP